MDQLMNDFQERLYLIFTGIFIASLVACNLIFQKFFTWNFLGLTFELSVGIIAYPITFLVTDLISELYGKKRANQVVISGFCASIFTTLLIFISMNATAADWSPVDSATFNKVFGLSAPAFLASMMAYLTAQFIDVRIFHFWKRLTKGKHLWLRNNVSTLCSQLIDTFVYTFTWVIATDLSLLSAFYIALSKYIFKVFIALLDTVFIYAVKDLKPLTKNA